VCNHMALNERCMAGQSCDPSMGGCVAGSGCGTDADCDDSIECTLDTCSVDMTCSNMAISSRCASGETCSPTLGCYVPMPCTVTADCQDDNFCNGAEVCMPEFGCAPAETPRMCDDTDDCTIDSCDTTSDMCAFACDTSRTECMCPVAGPTCTGSFSITPTVNYSCAFGMAAINLSTATFTNVSGVLSIRPASSSFPDPLSDVAPPICPMFEATHTVAGGCEEHYTIRGTFSDDDNFTGTVEIGFVQTDGISCTLGACANQTVMVTGTRM